VRERERGWVRSGSTSVCGGGGVQKQHRVGNEDEFNRTEKWHALRLWVNSTVSNAHKLQNRVRVPNTQSDTVCASIHWGTWVIEWESVRITKRRGSQSQRVNILTVLPNEYFFDLIHLKVLYSYQSTAKVLRDHIIRVISVNVSPSQITREMTIILLFLLRFLLLLLARGQIRWILTKR